MGNDSIQKLTMPKWGLSMTHGTVVEWLLPEGAEVAPGSQVLEVETDKIVGPVEVASAGTLRRQVAVPGQEVPVGGLLGVLADTTVSDEQIDQFVEAFLPEQVDSSAETEGPEYAFVEVEGRRLRYLQQGQGGIPAVLIHGFTGNLDNWLFNHAPLAERRAVLAVDLPGHGESSKEVGDGSLDMLIGTVQGWLDAIDVAEIHLVGHSLGGAVALGMALRDPQRVRSCTLIASAGLGPEIDAEYLRGVVASSRRKPLKAYLQRLFADPDRVTRQLVDDVLRFKRVDGVSEALELICEQLLRDDRQATVLRDELGNLQTPGLVLWGEHDRIIPRSHASDLPPNVAVETYPDCGHMVQMEAAREVNQRIAAFIDQADDAR